MFILEKIQSAPKVHPIEDRFQHVSRYHWYIFFVIFATKMPLFWHFITTSFLDPPMSYTCDDGTGEMKKNFCPCDKPIWDRSIFKETVQTKFQVICEKKAIKPIFNSILYAGAFVGAILFGILSDKIGRLTAYCISSFFLGLFGVCSAFVPSMYGFMAMRCLEGVGIGGAIVTSYVLVVEYCGIKQRELVSALYHLPLNIGHLCLAGVTYLVRDYAKLQIVVSIPIFFIIFMYCICNESPKWLMDSGQIDKANKVMENIAKFNGKSYGSSLKSEMQSYYNAHKGVTGHKEKFWHLFKYRHLTINFLCMSVNYFACGMGYYGVSQYISKMSVNIHENFAISGAMLIPATLSCTVLLYYLSRRTFLMITSFISGVILLVVAQIPSDKIVTLRIILACVGNSFFFMSFIIVFLYGVELFPTSVRNSVLGILSMISRMGQILAPVMNEQSQQIAGTLFGGFAVLGAFLCWPLPETKNMALPTSMEAFNASLSAKKSATKK